MTHLCFADHLLILVKAEASSVKLVKEALDAFPALSGLTANPSTSQLFPSGVVATSQQEIRSVLVFPAGNLVFDT